MKNLEKASDKEIYKLRELIRVFNWTSYKCSHTITMQKQIEKEWKARKIYTIPFSWDF